MFRISGIAIVVAQCKAGVIGSFPVLNARRQPELDNLYNILCAFFRRLQLRTRTVHPAVGDDPNILIPAKTGNEIDFDHPWLWADLVRGAGQGEISDAPTVAEPVARHCREYDAAKTRLGLV